MLEHLSNVQQELLYTQSRVDNKAREIETEDHLKRMTDREAGRLVVELKGLDKLVLDAADKMAALQASIYKGSEKMDQVRWLSVWLCGFWSAWGGICAWGECGGTRLLAHG